MNILIDINHPGHIHLFRNAYFQLIKNKHQVYVTARDVPIIKHLLDFYKIPYFIIDSKKNSIFGKGLSILKQDISVLKIVKNKKINVGVSSGIVLSHVAKITPMKTIICDDDDDNVEPFIVKFGHPLADAVLTPSVIKRKTTNSIAYYGTHELAYLHPKYFTPNIEVIKELNIEEKDKYFVLRFVALKGHHDIGHKGIQFEQKKQIIELLKPYGKVFITSEKPIEPEFEEYRIPIPPEKIHSFIYYSTMFLGDSQTMTSEAAIMGVPALKCNTFSGKLAVPNYLEGKYDLCYAYHPDKYPLFIEHIEKLLLNNNIKNEWKLKRERFLKDHIDVTRFMVWFIEHFPDSKNIINTNPDYLLNFK